jgi:hypothetical protein
MTPQHEMRMVKVKKKKRAVKARQRKGESLTEARYRKVLANEARWMTALTRALGKLKEAQKQRRYYENKFAAERKRRADARSGKRRSVTLEEDV